jgi:hypothetical protein
MFFSALLLGINSRVPGLLICILRKNDFLYCISYISFQKLGSCLLFDDRTHNIGIDVASGRFFVVSPAPVLCGFWKIGVGIVSLVIVFY